ncbi:hypothetical protein [Kutzneria buriramensis]|uniref:Uncharacterized protein n=1 Tax=Kutzneria buriramensis TaxID=1045776 RepID=A0A3E0I019_9PSEU|nr:hypothetical protein [Kutzneria buriramensis]REH52058.1 hypothetical protein BCF44_103507 [Kutzneria buriramensis]
MSQHELIAVGLLALAGFLIGGVYTMWKTAKIAAAVLGVLALLAAGGAIAWFMSN